MLSRISRDALAIGLLVVASCSSGKREVSEESTKVTKQSFGKTGGGEAVDIYTLRNKAGVEARITNYGGIVVSITTPDRTGKMDDVVLGFDSFDGYLTEQPFFGAVVGRYGNRIAKGSFKLGGVAYKLARNNGENHLHGGIKGFDKVVWDAKETTVGGAPGVELSYSSKDGEEGYPGNLQTKVTYSLNDNNELRIQYEATTDKDTVVNLTNHSYFNLAGEGDILAHSMMIDADRFTPVDAGLIPTGELRKVEGTPFDFRKPTPIGARIKDKDEQMGFGKGYDHNFVLNRSGNDLSLAARVLEPKSGRILEVLTTEPGVQFYTGNFLDGKIKGKAGQAYGQHAGFCLETQHYPDSPNQPSFPTTVLTKGGKYNTTTVFRFAVESAQ